jgi:hypothetical protein
VSTADPLATMISRAIGAEVSDVRSEVLGTSDGVEVERVRFRAGSAERSVVFERLAPRVTLEAQLLPFLARKTGRVPVVHARGIPHSVTPAPSWVMTEDLESLPSACDADPRAIVEAKIAVEVAVRGDVPALRALGVPERTPAAIADQIVAAADDPQVASESAESARRLAKWPVALVHGDLVCANASAADRGVVLKRWGKAYLGCALLDLVRLTADLVGRDDAVRGIGLSRLYAERLGLVLPTEILRAAEKLDRLERKWLDR